jgi:hypothetical protein
MTDMNQEAEKKPLTLEECSPELRQVVAFEEVPEELIDMLVSIHELSEPAVRFSWDALPASAQNILDNFEQYHALVSVSQTYSGVDFLGEMQSADLSHMEKEAAEEYKATMLDKILNDCVKEVGKQLKKARRHPPMKTAFQAIFKK